MSPYAVKSTLFKALADPTRLEIIGMISCGEICACKLLERFNVTQPTISHHMKILCDSGLAIGRKAGKWTYYTLASGVVRDLMDYLAKMTACEVCIVCDGISENEEDCDECG